VRRVGGPVGGGWSGVVVVARGGAGEEICCFGGGGAPAFGRGGMIMTRGRLPGALCGMALPPAAPSGVGLGWAAGLDVEASAGNGGGAQHNTQGASQGCQGCVPSKDRDTLQHIG